MSNSEKFLKGKTSIKDDIRREPAGSLQPMTANQDKWFANLNAQQLDRLSEIQSEVMGTADHAVTQLVRAKMKMGRLLNEARQMFPGDRQFGQWRKHNLPDISTTEVSYCMKIESTFGSAPELIDKMGWSVMREVSYAPESLINRIKADPDSAPTSKKEAREAVKEAKEEEVEEGINKARDAAQKGIESVEGEYVPAGGGEGGPAEITGREGMPEERQSPPPLASSGKIKLGTKEYSPLTIEEKWQYFLSMSGKSRIQRRREYNSDPFILMGLSPDTELAFVSSDTITILKTGHMENPDLEEKDIEAVKTAASALLDIWRERTDEVREDRFKDRYEAEKEVENEA